MQLLGIAIAITSLIGVGLLVVAALLALGAVGDTRAHPVVGPPPGRAVRDASTGA